MRQVAPRWSEKKGFERERKVIQKCMNISLTFGKKKGGRGSESIAPVRDLVQNKRKRRFRNFMMKWR